MKHLWKVTFDAKYTGLRELQEESVKIVANGDGMKAVNKARRRIVGSTFDDGPFSGGQWITRKCRFVKLTGLEMLSKIDA
jgi:hypothetical protein